METITKAAIKYPDGSILTSDRHWKIIYRQSEKGISSQRDFQGFVTSSGRFVDRTEAAEIALAADQLHSPATYLFSEHILVNEEEV